MATDPEFVLFAKDLFADIGPIKTTRMFGGTGIYTQDAMFAVLINGSIYMKADEPLIAEYLAAGSEPFSYDTKDGPRTIHGLTTLPDSAWDDPDEAMVWARKSLVPALETTAAKKAKKSKKAK